MNSKRIYRNALEKEKIIEELESCSGTQFDPVIAELFVRLIREGKVDTALLPAEPIGKAKWIITNPRQRNLSPIL